MSGASRDRRRRRARVRPAAVPLAPVAHRAQRPATSPAQPPTDLDVAALVKGASSGFSVLLVGELLAPVAAAVSPTLGGLWLSLVGATAYVVAGSRIGVARRAALQGLSAALLALGLTVPLRYIVGFGTPLWALLVSAGFAVLVGSVAGVMAGRRRTGARSGQA